MKRLYKKYSNDFIVLTALIEISISIIIEEYLLALMIMFLLGLYVITKESIKDMK